MATELGFSGTLDGGAKRHDGHDEGAPIERASAGFTNGVACDCTNLRFCPVRLARGNVPPAIKSMPLRYFDVPGRNIWATRTGAREGICGIGTGIRPA